MSPTSVPISDPKSMKTENILATAVRIKERRSRLKANHLEDAMNEQNALVWVFCISSNISNIFFNCCLNEKL